MKRGSARTAASKARRAVVFASSGAAGRGAGRPAAPQDVVGDDERARREAVRQRLEVAAVLGLERIDEDEVERAGERGPAVAERLERRRVDDRDPLVGDAGLAPPAAGEVGPLAVGVDRHDRPVGGLAERQPQRRVAVGRADLDDPAPAAGQHGQDAAGVAVDDRDAERRGGRLDGEPGPPARAGASDSIQSRSVASGIQSRSFLPIALPPFRPAGRRRSRGRRRGSSRPRSTRR